MTNPNLTTIAAIIDKSSSMFPLASETIIGFNTFLNEQKTQPGEATFTLVLFSDPHNYELVHDFVPLNSVPELNETSYKPSGCTALFDAIGKTIDNLGQRLAALPGHDRPSKVLVLIMTDGEENRSRMYAHERIQAMINHQREVYSWEFVFIGANQDAISAGTSLGVAASNSYNYTASAGGTTRVFRAMSVGVSSYRSAAPMSSYVMPNPTDADPTDAAPLAPSTPVVPQIKTPFVIKGSIIPTSKK